MNFGENFESRGRLTYLGPELTVASPHIAGSPRTAASRYAARGLFSYHPIGERRQMPGVRGQSPRGQTVRPLSSFLSLSFLSFG